MPDVLRTSTSADSLASSSGPATPLLRTHPHIVVGSGPAGVAAAKALLARGEDVLMLDCGRTIEESLQKGLDRLAQTAPQKWDQRAVARFKRPMLAAKGLPRKTVYGSAYSYADDVRLVDAGCAMSHAAGGLSTVWGAAMLPYAKDDLKDWPLPAEALDPYYVRVLDFVPLTAPVVTGLKDLLSQIFPLYTTPQEHAPSAQAAALFSRWRARQGVLEKKGYRVGPSRLAVHAYPRKEQPGCAYCGLCMYGCPYGLIYSSAHTLAELRSHPRFTYRSGVRVERIEEIGDHVLVHATEDAAAKESRRKGDRVWGARMRFLGSRVFLAAGAISSTAVMLASLPAVPPVVEGEDSHLRAATLLDSQYFFLPALLFRRTRGVTEERLHTLSQAFIEVENPCGVREKGATREMAGGRRAHLQIYTYSDLYENELRKKSGALYPLVKPFANLVLGRLIAIQGFLHSDDSGTMRVAIDTKRKMRQASGSPSVTVTGVPGPRAPVFRVVCRLLRDARILGFLPLPFLMERGLPGKGFHYGGSFPMRAGAIAEEKVQVLAKPSTFSSDLLGRPTGFTRTHLVDASVFPTIPATTITFTIMANAYRIATECGWGDGRIQAEGPVRKSGVRR